MVGGMGRLIECALTVLEERRRSIFITRLRATDVFCNLRLLLHIRCGVRDWRSDFSNVLALSISIDHPPTLPNVETESQFLDLLPSPGRAIEVTPRIIAHKVLDDDGTTKSV